MMMEINHSFAKFYLIFLGFCHEFVRKLSVDPEMNRRTIAAMIFIKLHAATKSRVFYETRFQSAS